MKALTLIQPWASLMAWGVKTIETRSWEPPANALGWIAIYAGKNTASLGDVHHLLREARAAAPTHPAFANVPDPLDATTLPLGAVIAIGHLIGAKRSEHLVDAPDLGANRPLGNFEPRRFGWIFDTIIPCPTPLPCRGFQKLWSAPPRIERELIALLPASQA